MSQACSTDVFTTKFFGWAAGTLNNAYLVAKSPVCLCLMCEESLSEGSVMAAWRSLGRLQPEQISQPWLPLYHCQAGSDQSFSTHPFVNKILFIPTSIVPREEAMKLRSCIYLHAFYTSKGWYVSVIVRGCTKLFQCFIPRKWTMCPLHKR